MKIVLISCTKLKQKYKCSAEMLYSASNLFRKELAYAKALTQKQNIYVISAKHGLLHLDEEIEPYDQTLLGQRKAVIENWSAMVFKQLENTIDFNNAEIIFLAGNNYRKYLIPLIEKKYPNVSISIPTEGMGIGNQLKFYNEKVKNDSL